MPWLVLAFIVVPIVELAVIVQVDDLIGLGPTIALLIFDSIVGAWLVRREGSRAWTRFREAIEARRWPGDEVTQGGLVLVGGALLLTPGFVTDALGLAMVAPPTRALFSRLIRRRLRSMNPLTSSSSGSFGSGRSGRQDQRGDGDVLDVEVVSVERDEPQDGPEGTGDGPGEGDRDGR